MSTKGKLTPKLRFPEFRNASAWEQIPLAQIAERVTTKNLGGDSTRVLTNSAEHGVLDQRDYFDKDIATAGNLEGYYVVDRGDYVYNPRISNIAPVGPISRNNIGKGVMSPLYTVFRFAGNNTDFYAHYLKTTCWHTYLRHVASTGARHDRMSISVSDFMAMPLPAPSPAEQQKVADCLSSLDELVAAEGRKLESLRAYRKGLMQQIFLRDGETTPRVRFPEFHNAGEWVKKPFSDLCDISHGYAFESEYFNNEGEYVLLSPGNFYEQGGYRDRGEQQKYYTGEIPRDYVLAQGDMLVAMTEQAAGLLGSTILVPQSDKFLHNQRLGLVTGKPGVAWANEFFFHVFNTEPVRKAIHDTAAGTKVRHTSPTKIGEVAVSAPTSSFEQQRIAACLSSLDGLLSAALRKVEALKQHKKGLMQQLFPSAGEA